MWDYYYYITVIGKTGNTETDKDRKDCYYYITVIGKTGKTETDKDRKDFYCYITTIGEDRLIYTTHLIILCSFWRSRKLQTVETFPCNSCMKYKRIGITLD